VAVTFIRIAVNVVPLAFQVSVRLLRGTLTAVPLVGWRLLYLLLRKLRCYHNLLINRDSNLGRAHAVGAHRRIEQAAQIQCFLLS